VVTTFACGQCGAALAFEGVRTEILAGVLAILAIVLAAR
jgi:hypothetical protein